MSRARLRIIGRVQGVFYRHSTRETAQSLGLKGWVRNMADGSVEVEAEGAKDKVDALINWLQKGPPRSQVEKVDVEWVADETDCKSEFEIR